MNEFLIIAGSLFLLRLLRKTRIGQEGEGEATVALPFIGGKAIDEQPGPRPGEVGFIGRVIEQGRRPPRPTTFIRELPTRGTIGETTVTEAKPLARIGRAPKPENTPAPWALFTSPVSASHAPPPGSVINPFTGLPTSRLGGVFEPFTPIPPALVAPPGPGPFGPFPIQISVPTLKLPGPPRIAPLEIARSTPHPETSMAPWTPKFFTPEQFSRLPVGFFFEDISGTVRRKTA